ncbi:transcriptional regulator, TetR family [Limimonas halophila]|uniref:Transcriptional regulator, TetR family n=1 Tax=Limimonas halophila TaxID=1082479 RepID=A0A1G7KWX3_9PROT|nr:helix-turn-helix domain-containing protein [Limimonas halophila]SDF41747.1 transcriptional regulator, TetR family [Limimonas halophila]
MATTSEAAETGSAGMDHERVIEAAMHLAAVHGWEQLALRDVARAAGASLAELHRAHPSKQHILRAYTRGLDQAILDAQEPEDLGEPARDRMFEVLMQRFERMQPNREAIRAVLHSYQRDPLLAVGGLCQLRRSMATMLEAADLSSAGMRGRIRRDGLCGLYLAVLRTWLSDDTTDMSRTMATLDTYLRRVEQPVAVMEGLRARGAERERTL